MRRRPHHLLVVAALVLAGCAGAHGQAGAGRSATIVAPSLPNPAGSTSSSPPVTRARRHYGVVPGTTVVATLVSNGAPRSYRLHTPTSFDSAVPAPLVVVLHGASGNAARVEVRYHWDPVSDRDGFFVVYPQGLSDQWNASLAPRAVDDVSFLGALVDRLVRTLPIDRRRVFVAGMSNGGAMTYRIGCALSDRVAAIAPVEAANPGCRPSRPVSMVAIHGLADHQVSFAAAQQSVATWRGFDGCPADPRTEQRGPVTQQAWQPCAGGTSVALYAVANSGHEWPGSSPPLPGHDRPSRDLDATQAVWDFFAQHPR